MAKQVVYFNATKQIETITIHYNQKLDAVFVEDVARSIKDISKKMGKIDLKNPKEYYNIQVFIYPSKQLFYKIFGGEIEKRFYSRRRSLEDLYIVQDAEGNIHIVSPRGMAPEKRDELKKILVMKVLGEYMEEKEKQSALRLLKEAMKPKVEEEQEEIEELEEEELQDEPEEAEQENESEQVAIEDEPEEVEASEQIGLEDLQETIEEPEEIEPEYEQELDEEELEEIIETELILEQVDETKLNDHEKNKNAEDKKPSKRSEAQEWLNIGWLAYISGRLKKEADIKRFAENISVNGIKKLGQLSNTRLLESYNFSREYAYAWVEYIVTTYGMKKFAEHYENPKDIQGVFGVPKFVFESQLKAYIKEKYRGDEKVLNITEDIELDDIVHEVQEEKEEQSPIAELTILHFCEAGGVDIVTAEPIQKEPKSIEEII